MSSPTPDDLINDELAEVRFRASTDARPGSRPPPCSPLPPALGRGATTPEEEIRKLMYQTLVVHGREDQVIPVETSLKLLRAIDTADLPVFSHCGHRSQIERKVEFNRLVSDFLKR